MTFKAVPRALAKLAAKGKEVHGSKKFVEEVTNKLSDLSAAYFKLGDAKPAPVDYSSVAARFAYVFKYVGGHAYYLSRVLRILRDEKKKPVFAQASLKVACLGGGPGSDIIGVLKFLELHSDEPVKKASFQVLDFQKGWKDAWAEINAVITDKRLSEVKFHQFNVAAVEALNKDAAFLKSDLFTMSYFVSEVCSLPAKAIVEKFWRMLFANAKAGALFLYIDNGNATFNAQFDKMCEAAGLELLIHSDKIEMQASYPTGPMEEYIKMLDHRPKLKGTLSYRVLRKPG